MRIPTWLVPIMEVQIGFDCGAFHLSIPVDSAGPEFIQRVRGWWLPPTPQHTPGAAWGGATLSFPFKSPPSLLAGAPRWLWVLPPPKSQRLGLFQALLNFSDRRMLRSFPLFKGAFVSSPSGSEPCLELARTGLPGLLKHHYANGLEVTLSPP